jgi:tetratricopeptide (TPR) repeat protein
MSPPSGYKPIFITVWLLAAPGITSTQSAAGNTLIGKVRSQAGRPVPNVLIELHNGNGALITQTFTSNEGDFAFTGLAGASFLLVINDPNHKPLSERVELTKSAVNHPGDVVRVDLTLLPIDGTTRPQSQGVVFHQDVPSNARDLYRSGVTQLADRKNEEAVAAFREALALFPDYFDARFALGLELLRQRRYHEAAAELERARKVNPRNGRLYHTFGLLLVEQKRYPQAVEVFEAAARLDPSNAEAHLMRAAALIEMGRLDDARIALNRAEQLSANKLALVHAHRARIHERQGDRRRAADELELYLKKSPNTQNADSIREAIKKLRSS